MSGSLSESLTAIVLAIIGVATLAVIVSKNSNTVGVIGASASAFSTSLGTALSPITGGAGSYGSNISAFPIG